MFLPLVLALVVPAVLVSASPQIGVRRKFIGDRGWAWAALLFVALWWGLRDVEHAHAESLVEKGSYITEPVRRIAAEPYMSSPFQWHVHVDTGNAYRMANVETLHDQVDLSQREILKGPITPAVAAARQSYLGKVFVDWSTWPLIEDMGSLPIPSPGASHPLPAQNWHTVGFLDLRFDSPSLLLESAKFKRKAGTASLIGWVYVGPQQQIEGQYMHWPEAAVKTQS